MINHPEKFIKGVCRIKCEEDHGTGFFISPNLILTANHTIIDYDDEETEIGITLADNTRLTAKIVAQDQNLDIALLEIAGEHENSDHFPIILNSIRYNEEWSTFGYPFSKLATGQFFQGTVQAHTKNLPYDLNLISVEIDIDTDYSGLSGSPLLIDGKVNGIITWSTYRGLGAVSVAKIKEFLDNQSVEYENLNDALWSEEFNIELERIVENRTVVSNLKDTLEGNGNYILLHGSPGSGKSVISSSITPRFKSTIILGRYLLRIPGDVVPIFVKATKEYFMQWLEDILSKYITGEPIPKSDIKWDKRLVRFNFMLNEVNELLITKDERAVIIIDGLDEVRSIDKEGLNAFLGMFPEHLPSNISVLLSCTSQEILPVFISSQIPDNNKIPVTPLDISVTERFLRNENDRLNLGLSSVQFAALGNKSEGHPLYLHYIIETLKNTQVSERDEWIERLPTISGDIRNYYESVWSKYLGLNSDNYWISLIGSQLREPVEKEEFKKMLPENTRNNFQIQFPHIKHLFKIGKDISIYHQSFENFIGEKAGSDIKNANGYISDYNIHANGSKYGLKNLLHHLLLSENPIPAIARCDQKWADDCALIHMEPDRVVADVERVEELCIDEADITELVRIKLLLQRLRFRYNTILAANAYELADALINMGEADAALSYIIRQDSLLISTEDALYFLQKLQDIEAKTEVIRLERAINLRFQMLEEKSKNSGGLTMNVFYDHLRFNTVCLSREKLMPTMATYMAGSNALLEIYEDDNETDEVQEAAKRFRSNLQSYFIAYSIYRLQLYHNIAKMSEFSGYVYTKETAPVLAKAVLFYRDFSEKSARTIQENESFKKLLADIEELVCDQGYDDEEIEILLFALIEETKHTDIMDEMILKKLSDPVKFRLRLPNGVDPDLDSVEQFYQEQIYKGYIDKSGHFPILSKYGAQTWEKYILSLYELCGFLQGKVFRMKAEENFEQLTVLQQKACEVFEKLDFKLKDRVTFERSYHLIEDIIPLLYHRLLMIFLDLGGDVITWFVERILNPVNEQFGMYSEGYRRTLFELSAELTKIDRQKQNAFKIVKALEEYVYQAVQNRWERTPELIEIVGFYAKIGAKSKAQSIYQQMLNSSMGPNWYKESQFGLINSALREMNHDNADRHYSDFAAQLEYASGELTFQRYVKSAICGFVGTLAQAGHVAKAIEYFKFQVLPSAEIILENAESSVIDAPVKGDGYVLGARAIMEADAMGKFLLSTNGDPMLIFALSEVFILNDDTGRYIDSFTKVQYRAYLLAKDLSEQIAVEILERITWLVSHERFCNEKNLYLRSLYSNFKTDLDKLHDKLICSGIDKMELPDTDKKAVKPKVFTVEEEETLAKLGGPFPGTGKMSNYPQIEVANKEAKEEFTLENIGEGLKKLVDCLKILANDGTDIWQGKHLTGELGTLFDLFKTYASPQQIVELLKPFIINHITDDWYIISFLLGLLSDKVDMSTKQSIILYVKEHIEIIIRSEGTFKSKYEWLSVAKDNTEKVDESLLEFLIWWLNHPFQNVRNNAFEALSWLSEKRSSLVLPTLIDVSLANTAELCSEYSGYLLKRVSVSQSKELWKFIKDNIEIQTRILELEHTMIEIYWLQILENCKTEDEVARDLSRRFGIHFPSENFRGSDIFIEDSSLDLVIGVLEDLNNLNILNGAFMRAFNEKREILVSDLGEAGHSRVEKYIRRSFLGENLEIKHLQYKFHTAINRALSGRSSIKQINEITEILELVRV